MATQFKFTKADGLTRRMTFSELPSWTALAMKIESLYSIPIEKVAVSYVDADGDEVTLSSQEELLDFYANCHKRGEAVRFNVMDLSSVRSRGVTTSPNTDDAKMTTGLGHMGPTMLFEVDDSDWQPLSSFPGIFTLPRAASPSVPDHAYVEVVESDVQSEGKNDLDRQSSIFNAAEVPIVTVDDVSLEAFGEKGKQREMDTDSVASFKKPLSPTVEELDERDEDPLDMLQTPTAPKSRLFSPEMPAIDSFGKPLPKTPSTRPTSFDHFAPPYSPRSAGFSNLENMVRPMSEKQETVRGDNAGDPPLESTGAQQSSAAPSLSSDVANFLDALSSAFNTHPELSEGFRNIVRNATNGSYWNKEGLSNAAEHISRNWLRGDEDAGNRVAQSLASVFKVIGDATAVGSNAAQAEGPGSDYRPFVPIPPGGDRHFWNSPPPPPPGFGVPAPPPGFPGSPFPPFHPGHPGAPPPHPPHHPFGSPMHPPPMHPPPPPPPGPPRHGPFPPPPGPPGHSGMPPPLPPPPGHNGPAPGIPPHQRTHPGWIEQIMGDVGVPRRSNTWSGTYRGPANPPPPRRIPDDYMSPHDRKAMLETAKAHYKAEKERFRLEKEERKRSRREVEERREREANGPVVFDNGETVITRIPLKVFEASPNTWNRSGGPSADSSTRRRPYAEVYSVPSPPRAQPQPHAAISSRTTSIHEPEVEKSESNIRILSRLADMGFTPSSHPTLPALLEKEVRADEILSTHEEDDAVMHVLETLISNTSVSPRPSGSNLA